MGNRIFDAYQNGVSRNPHHPRGKAVFAINFDLLKFKVDGESVEASEVIGAFPTQAVLIRMARDDAGTVLLDDHGDPQFIAMPGKVEIIGDPVTCGCSMTKFRVSRWWEQQLTET